MKLRGLSDLPLLARLVLALVLVAAVPFAVSLYQIHAGRTAVVDQVQKTHLASVLATAERVQARLELLRAATAATAGNPYLYQQPTSAGAEELLAGLLIARPELVAAGLYTDAGSDGAGSDVSRPLAPELIRLAQLRDESATVAEALAAIDDRPLVVVDAGGERWLRLRVPSPEPRLFVVALARVAALERLVRPDELLDQAQLALVERDGRVLAGAWAAADPIAPRLLELAGSDGGGTASGASTLRLEDGQRVIAAYSTVAGSPWLVLSRQPARVAELATARQRQVTRAALLIVLALTALLAFWAQRSIVQPIRRLVRAQRDLAGVTSGIGETVHGGEIEELERTFAVLERNLHDREALSRLFLGRYQVIELLGVGAMGTVFRGWDPRLRRPVALKTVKLGAYRATDRAELAAQLVREAVTLAQLSHPNIVTVFDVESQGESAFLAMELVEGMSLEQYLRGKKEGLPLEQVTAIARAILNALTAAHRLEILHQDLKPANILLGEDGAIKVTDFGISDAMTRARRQRDLICGTPGYVPPELIAGDGFDTRGDLFATGVVLYHCLTGYRPFTGRNPREVLLATLRHRVERPSRLRPRLPPVLQALVLQLLAKDPADRPASAEAALRVLESLTPELPPWRPRADDLTAAKEESEDDENRPHTSFLSTRLLPAR